MCPWKIGRRGWYRSFRAGHNGYVAGFGLTHAVKFLELAMTVAGLRTAKDMLLPMRDAEKRALTRKWTR